MEIYVDVSMRPLTIFKDCCRPLPYDKTLWSAITCVQSWSALFLGSADFTNCPQRQCGAFVLITLSCEPLLYANYCLWSYCGDHANHYLACNYRKWLFSSLVLRFPRGRCRELLGCHRMPLKTSYAVIAGAAVWPRGYVGIYWIQSHQKKTMLFYASRGGRVFSQLSRIRVQLIRRTGRPIVVRMVKGRLVAAGYHSKHPDRCPRLTHHHRCRRRMLADIPQNWNHRYWSHSISDDESRVSIYHFDHRAGEFHLFLGCNNPLAFQQRDVTVVEADYGLISK